MNRSRTGSSSVATGAAALLQKARGQARGQQFAAAGSKSNIYTSQSQKQLAAQTGNEAEDDIAAYLSQLSKKTSGIKKQQYQADDLNSGLSDLSLSDEQASGVNQVSTPMGSNQSLNKFMKKPTKSLVPESKSATFSPSKKEAAQRPSSAIVQRSPSKFTSSALQKASKLGAKITARKKGVPGPVDSDLSEEDIGRPPHVSKGQVSTFAASATLAPDDDAPGISDGNRFLKKSSSKKTSSAALQPQSTEVSVTGDYDGYSQGRGLRAQDSSYGGDDMPGTFERRDETWKTSTPFKGAEKKGSTKGSVYNRIMAHLDTDEEDMEDLIGGVSSPEPILHKKKEQQPQRKESKRAVTPYKPPDPVSESESSHTSLSVSYDLKESKINEGITVEDLEPVAIDLSSVQSVETVDESSSIAEDVSLGPNLAGIQTIDDLLPRDIPTPLGNVRELITAASETYHDDFESVSERTVSPMMVPSPSPRPVLVEETDSSASSASSICEVSYSLSSRTVADSHSEVSTRSSRRESSRSYSRSSRSAPRSSFRSYSRSTSRTSDTADSITSIASRRSSATAYSEDFDSVSHSNDDTLIDDRTVTSDYSTSPSQKHSQSASQASSSVSRRKHKKSRKSIHRDSSKNIGKNAAVQTSSSLHGMDHHWVKDLDFQTPGYFKLLSSHIHDTMSHTVDPMLLQTLSSFDPRSLDLHASLAEQVRQTRLALTNTLRGHQTFLESLEENYTYTTLEDTKQFIKKQKKRRRKEEERMQAALQELDVNVDG